MEDAELNATQEAIAEQAAAVKRNIVTLKTLLADEILLSMVTTEIGELALEYADDDDTSWYDIGQEAIRNLISYMDGTDE